LCCAYDWVIANLRYRELSRMQGNEAALQGGRQMNLNRFERGPMARRNFPDVTPEVVEHDSGWAIWLVAILGGVLAVFALTALIVSFLI